MIKYCSLLLTLVLSTSSLWSQHFIGIKNTYSLNDISAVPTLGSKAISSAFNPALVYNYTHRKNAAVQVELAFVNKGYELKPDTAKGTPAIRHNITSVELPLMTQLFLPFGMFRPYFAGGVTIGYITKRTVDSLDHSWTYVFDKYDRRFEYGLAVGLGTGIRVNRFELQVEGLYHYNFSFLRTPVIVGKPNQYINSTRMAISVSLLYRFAERKGKR